LRTSKRKLLLRRSRVWTRKRRKQTDYDEMMRAVNEYGPTRDIFPPGQAGSTQESDRGRLQIAGSKRGSQAAAGGAEKFQEAAARERELDAKQVAEENADLERQLTLTAAREGKERGQNYEAEYDARKKLLDDQYRAGEIDAKAYTADSRRRRSNGRPAKSRRSRRT